MAYATLAQVQVAAGGADALRKISDQDGSGSTQQATIDAAVAEADGLIDSFVHKRHRVPLTSPSLSVQTLSARHAVRVMRSNVRMSITKDITDEENDRAWLAMGAKGLVSFVDEPQPAPSNLAVDSTSAGTPSTREVSRRRTRGIW